MAVRGLSRAQAEAGHQPPRLIKAEWKMLHAASLVHESAAKARTNLSLDERFRLYCKRPLPPSADD